MTRTESREAMKYLAEWMAKAQNALASGEEGQVNFNSSVGLFAFVVVILFIAWLCVKAGIVTIP